MNIEILPLTEEDYKEIYGSYEQETPFRVIELVNYDRQEQSCITTPFSCNASFSITPAYPYDELWNFLELDYIKQSKGGK
jgi:hypothetical protein